MIDKIKRRADILFRNYKWRKKNQHNGTWIKNLFDIERIHVGNGTYGALYILMHDKKTNVFVGNYCSIADDVTFIPAADHEQINVSTYPFKVKYCGVDCEATSRGDIVIDDDVWIGHGVTILSNVHVGRGAILAAGAVITSDVPPYAVVGGIPAKVIRYRFSQEIIEKLLTINFEALTVEKIQKNIQTLYTSITEQNVQEIVNKLNNE